MLTSGERMRLRLSSQLLVLLAVGLALRLSWVAVHHVTPVSDFAEYNQHAATLVTHGNYSDNPRYSDAYWEPGWPVVLAALYSVFGVHPLLGAVLGTLLEWGAIVVAAVAASRLLRPRFATLSVAAMCLYPGAIAYGPVLGTEHLAALLFTAVVVLVALAQPTSRTALTAGLLAGASILTRSEYGAATVVLIAVWLWRALPMRRVVNVATVSAAGALICLGPWIARNAITFGEFIPASTNGGVTFYLGTVSPRYTEPPIVKRLGDTSTRHPAAHDEMWLRMGLRNVIDNPLRWLAFDVQRIPYQYGQETLLLNWGRINNPVAQRVANIYWLTIVALALIGVGSMIAARRQVLPAWWLIAGSIAAVSLLKTAFIVNQRDRLPLTYLLILIAGLGTQRLADLIAARARRLESR